MVIGCFWGRYCWFDIRITSTNHCWLISDLGRIYDVYRCQKAIDPTKTLPSSGQQVAAGSVIGVASAIFGIGGGSLTVPYLNRYGVVMQKAVGTSAACGLPIAVAGALGFMLLA